MNEIICVDNLRVKISHSNINTSSYVNLLLHRKPNITWIFIVKGCFCEIERREEEQVKQSIISRKQLWKVWSHILFMQSRSKSLITTTTGATLILKAQTAATTCYWRLNPSQDLLTEEQGLIFSPPQVSS